MSEFNFNDFNLDEMSNEAAFGFDPAILAGIDSGEIDYNQLFDQQGLSDVLASLEAGNGADLLGGVDYNQLFDQQGLSDILGEAGEADLSQLLSVPGALGLSEEALSGSADLGGLADRYSDTTEEVQPWQNLEGSGTTQLSDAYKYEDGKWSIRGDYDEETGRFVPNPNGTFTANEENEFDPLKNSGTNADSMKNYTYDQKTGTWTTPSGQVYTPDKPSSHTAKSGAQVMVNAGALPSGYSGLTADKGSTADTKGTSTGSGSGSGTKTGTGSDSDKSGLGALLPLLLMMLAMNRGGGSSEGKGSIIPALTALQKQTPYASQQKAAGYRPGQGGINYFEPTQYVPKMAAGGGISRLLQGPGDGVSDSIPAVIDGGMAGGGQPAKVARGEYIIDARTVAAVGNGSTDAGAERLDKMRENILRDDRKAGVGQDSKAYRHLMA